MCSTNNETPIERNQLQILQNYALIVKIFERISRGFIVKAGTKGGKAGQWSARKAQLLAKQYKEKGGGYK